MSSANQQPMYKTHHSSISEGAGLGLLAVAAFSLTLPITRIAIQQLDAWFIGFSRSAIAGVIAVIILVSFRCPLPNPSQFTQLLWVACGIVFGFPIFSALGMESVPASHGGIVLGILPLMTAACGCYLNHERNSRIFWISSVLAAVVVIVYASGGNIEGWKKGDSWLIAAIVAAAWGYAVGGRLSAQLGGWQVICWALVISLPISVPMTAWLLPTDIDVLQPSTWLAMLYLSLISQLLGFFAWNKALAIGGISRVSQIQLLQPFLTLAAAALFLQESIDLNAILSGLLVLLLVSIGFRSRYQS